MSIDKHPLRYSPIERAVEAVLSRRSIENRIDGYVLETSIEVAQAVIDLLCRRPEFSSQQLSTPEK